MKTAIRRISFAARLLLCSGAWSTLDQTRNTLQVDVGERSEVVSHQNEEGHHNEEEKGKYKKAKAQFKAYTPGYDLAHNTRCFKNEGFLGHTNDADECAALCDNIIGCKHFSFSNKGHEDQNCFEEYQCDDDTKFNRYALLHGDLNSADNSFKLADNGRTCLAESVSLGNFERVTLCANACTEKEGCEFFSFQVDGSCLQLHTHSPGCDQGFRRAKSSYFSLKDNIDEAMETCSVNDDKPYQWSTVPNFMEFLGTLLETGSQADCGNGQCTCDNGFLTTLNPENPAACARMIDRVQLTDWHNFENITHWTKIDCKPGFALSHFEKNSTHLHGTCRKAPMEGITCDKMYKYEYETDVFDARQGQCMPGYVITGLEHNALGSVVFATCCRYTTQSPFYIGESGISSDADWEGMYSPTEYHDGRFTYTIRRTQAEKKGLDFMLYFKKDTDEWCVFDQETDQDISCVRISGENIDPTKIDWDSITTGFNVLPTTDLQGSGIEEETPPVPGEQAPNGEIVEEPMIVPLSAEIDHPEQDPFCWKDDQIATPADMAAAGINNADPTIEPCSQIAPGGYFNSIAREGMNDVDGRQYDTGVAYDEPLACVDRHKARDRDMIAFHHRQGTMHMINDIRHYIMVQICELAPNLEFEGVIAPMGAGVEVGAEVDLSEMCSVQPNVIHHTVDWTLNTDAINKESDYGTYNDQECDGVMAFFSRIMCDVNCIRKALHTNTNAIIDHLKNIHTHLFESNKQLQEHYAEKVMKRLEYKLALSEFNLRKQSQTETGQLSSQLSTMLSALSESLGGISTGISGLDGSLNDLHETVGVISTTVGIISGNVDGLSGDVDSLSRDVNNLLSREKAAKFASISEAIATLNGTDLEEVRDDLVSAKMLQQLGAVVGSYLDSKGVEMMMDSIDSGEPHLDGKTVFLKTSNDIMSTWSKLKSSLEKSEGDSKATVKAFTAAAEELGSLTSASGQLEFTMSHPSTTKLDESYLLKQYKKHEEKAKDVAYWQGHRINVERFSLKDSSASLARLQQHVRTETTPSRLLSLLGRKIDTVEEKASTLQSLNTKMFEKLGDYWSCGSLNTDLMEGYQSMGRARLAAMKELEIRWPAVVRGVENIADRLAHKSVIQRIIDLSLLQITLPESVTNTSGANAAQWLSQDGIDSVVERVVGTLNGLPLETSKHVLAMYQMAEFFRDRQALHGVSISSESTSRLSSAWSTIKSLHTTALSPFTTTSSQLPNSIINTLHRALPAAYPAPRQCSDLAFETLNEERSNSLVLLKELSRSKADEHLYLVMAEPERLLQAGAKRGARTALSDTGDAYVCSRSKKGEWSIKSVGGDLEVVACVEKGCAKQGEEEVLLGNLPEKLEDTQRVGLVNLWMK